MKHVNLRVPDDIHAVLVAAAEAERRSLNSMVIIMIEEALQRRADHAQD
jgi:predicted HicB family RNase H-like nuclease